MDAAENVPAPVDPRVDRSRRVIRQAALDELTAAGYGAFSIESVARRARVAKTTVYRHWGNKVALIADAFETLNRQPASSDDDPPDTDYGDTPREQVERILRHLANVMADSPFSACVPALIEAAEHDAAIRDFYHQYSARRRQNLTDAIAAGVKLGDFPGTVDPDAASQALAGAVFYRRLNTDSPFRPDEVGTLVTTVLGSPPD